MKTFTIHATRLLLERAEALETEDHHGWRCIYLRLSDKRERFNETLRVNFINRAIVEMLARDEGYIYFCDDGDILILFEGALKPVAEKLSSHFGDLDPGQLRGQPEGEMFSFFDLSKHWEGFFQLCYEKAARALPVHEKLSTLHFSHSPQRTGGVSA